MPLAIELAAARIKLLPPEAILDRLRRPAGDPRWRRARPARAPADPARRDRLELRPARRARPPAAPPAVRLRRRLQPRAGRGDLRTGRRARARRPRRDRGARRPEPAAGRGGRPASRASGCSRRSGPSPPSSWRPAARPTRSASATPGPSWPSPRRLPRSCPAAEQRAWLDRLDVEHDNLRAAIDWATARPDPEVAIGLGFALWRFWQKRGYLLEGRRRLDRIAGRALVAATIRPSGPG